MPVNAAVVSRPRWTESLAHPLRSFHTVRHLYPEQVVNRATRRFQSMTTLPASDDALVLRCRAGVPPAASDRGAFDGRGFVFLNRRVSWEGTDRWHPTGADDLWVYNLHYFQYVWTMPVETARTLIEDWIGAATAPQTFGWHPYPISLRVREWIEWLLVHPELDEPFRQSVSRSIVQQVEALNRLLEFHLMGNHLLENAITLCWAGLSFDGRRAAAWLDKGLGILRRELGRQVLADGSHDERSPMYQALIAEAVLRLNEVAALSDNPRSAEVGRLASTVGRDLLHALGRMVHPDGGYALLNDASLSAAPSLQSLVRRFGGDTQSVDRARIWSLPSAGYLGYNDHRGHYLVFDAGAIGPDHQPGHGHADTLSFELSHRGRRIVTDTGVLTYKPGRDRTYDRGTAAHNTVQVDGRDQSELWGAFRCARRPSVHTATAEQGRTGATLHGGYRGPGRGLATVSHTRQIFSSGSVLAFTDAVSASGAHSATARLHFAPGLALRQSDRVWILEDEARRRVASVVGDGFRWTEMRSPYHPEFGREHERACLVASVPFRHRATLKWWLLVN
jgi:uncharacterized heparinase superfamily protein